MNEPRKLKGMENISNQQPQQQNQVIKFNMAEDEKVRNIARKGYEISKVLKDVGLKFRKVIPAFSDQSVRKLFRLPNESDLICLEIDTTSKTEDQKMIDIGEIKDQLLLMDNITLIDEKPYVYDRSRNVYRFLLKYNQPKK